MEDSPLFGPNNYNNGTEGQRTSVSHRDYDPDHHEI